MNEICIYCDKDCEYLEPPVPPIDYYCQKYKTYLKTSWFISIIFPIPHAPTIYKSESCLNGEPEVEYDDYIEPGENCLSCKHFKDKYCDYPPVDDEAPLCVLYEQEYKPSPNIHENPELLEGGEET